MVDSRLALSRRAWMGVLTSVALAALGCRRESAASTPARRLVTLGGTLTETVSALGAAESLVGIDGSSTFPEAVTRLPNVGYHRRFSVEGVIGLAPTLVLLTDEAGPPAAVEQLKQAGIPLLLVPSGHSVEVARERILAIGRGLSLESRAKELVATLDRELDAARREAAISSKRPRVLFIYARGRGALSVAGTKTAADEMLRLAGAENAAASFEGFRPLSPESVVQAAPEVLLVTALGKQGLGGDPAVLELPGVALTPAGRDRRIVAMDDLLLLGFGPRLGQAVGELVKALRS